MIGLILAVLALCVAVLSTEAWLRHDRAARELEETRASLAKRIEAWDCPEPGEDLLARLRRLAETSASSSTAVRQRGRMAADALRQDLDGVPDIVLAAIVACLTSAIENVELIACREQLDCLDLVRIVFTACAAELSAVELETV